MSLLYKKPTQPNFSNIQVLLPMYYHKHVQLSLESRCSVNTWLYCNVLEGSQSSEQLLK